MNASTKSISEILGTPELVCAVTAYLPEASEPSIIRSLRHSMRERDKAKAWLNACEQDLTSDLNRTRTRISTLWSEDEIRFAYDRLQRAAQGDHREIKS
jgi:hypothetical protein